MQRLKLKYDALLSSYASIEACVPPRWHIFDTLDMQSEESNMVWRCRLMVSKTVLKAPMVSALDTIIR
jgi:hypothetical protein